MRPREIAAYCYAGCISAYHMRDELNNGQEPRGDKWREDRRRERDEEGGREGDKGRVRGRDRDDRKKRGGADKMCRDVRKSEGEEERAREGDKAEYSHP